MKTYNLSTSSSKVDDSNTSTHEMFSSSQLLTLARQLSASPNGTEIKRFGYVFYIEQGFFCKKPCRIDGRATKIFSMRHLIENSKMDPIDNIIKKRNEIRKSYFRKTSLNIKKGNNTKSEVVINTNKSNSSNLLKFDLRRSIDCEEEKLDLQLAETEGISHEDFLSSAMVAIKNFESKN